MRFPLACLAAAALLALPAYAQEERLGEAKQLLVAIPETQVRQGIEICVKANSVKSVALLLDVLQRKERLADRMLDAAHYRDMAWDGLLRITDPYARARVAKLARSSRNAWVRQWCVELLGIWGDRDFGDVVTKACRDRNAYVRRWAARSLGILKHKEGESALLKLRRDRDPYIRANAIEALALIDPKKHGLLFHEALKGDEDGGVRCALLGAVPAAFPQEVVALSTAALQDKDWCPRMQAVDNLYRKEKLAVDGLVAAARDGRPVVADRAMKYLRKLTGKEIRDADAWSGWWGSARETFKFPDEKKAEEKGSGEEEGAAGDKTRRTVAFNQIPLVSDHVAFLIDKSYLMKRTLEATGTTKDLAAHGELKRVLEQLHGRLVFNVFCYREKVVAFRKEPVALDEKQEKKALRFVAREKDEGAKDIWGCSSGSSPTPTSTPPTCSPRASPTSGSTSTGTGSRATWPTSTGSTRSSCTAWSTASGSGSATSSRGSHRPPAATSSGSSEGAPSARRYWFLVIGFWFPCAGTRAAQRGRVAEWAPSVGLRLFAFFL